MIQFQINSEKIPERGEQDQQGIGQKSSPLPVEQAKKQQLQQKDRQPVEQKDGEVPEVAEKLRPVIVADGQQQAEGAQRRRGEQQRPGVPAMEQDPLPALRQV